MTARTVLLITIARGIQIVGSPPPILPGVAYSFTFTINGQAAKYTFTKTGTLPTGITFTDNGNGTATLAGTTSATGSYPISVIAQSNTRQTDTKKFILSVPALTLQLLQTVQLYRGIAVTGLTLKASGGTGTGYTYSIFSGAPAGVTMSAGGVGGGTPTTITSYTTVYKVVDSAANAATVTVNMVVNSRLTLVGQPPDNDYGYGSTFQLSVLGATGAVTWSGAPPAGLTMSAGGLLTLAAAGGSSTVFTALSFSATATDAGTGDTLVVTIVQNVYPFLTIGSGFANPVNLVIGIPTVVDAAAILALSNFKPPYTYSFATGITPAWVTVAPNGITTLYPPLGTSPAVAMSVSIKITDSIGHNVNRNLAVNIVSAAQVPQPKLNGSTSGLDAGPFNWNFVGPYTLTSVAGSDCTLTLPSANGGTAGYLLASDWSSFNSKQSTITFSTVGAVPNSSGASIVAGVITLQAADVSNPGLMTTGVQTFGGRKTFSGSSITVNGTFAVNNESTSFNYGSVEIDKGTVTTAVTFNFTLGDRQKCTLTTLQSLVITLTAPTNPCTVHVKIIAPAAGTSSAFTWPASVKGAPPTTVTLAKTSLFKLEWDGTSYFYMGGCLNV